MAGIISAISDNGFFPKLKTMLLKVTDETFDPYNPTYAYSDVVRAVDYGYGKGARIFSMSFGNDARNSMRNTYKASLDAAASAYQALFRKYPRALFVTAAGNEWTDLDTWKALSYTCSPCMVDAPNVICVGATDEDDMALHFWAGNRDQGTNYGPKTVDMGAPGTHLYTTDVDGGNSYVYGTSYASPMTAAVAGLALLALGSQDHVTESTPALLKEILMRSGDPVNVTKSTFVSMRRLNAANVVSAALTLSHTG